MENQKQEETKTESVTKALQTVDLNSQEKSSKDVVEGGCALCGKAEPKKKCSKSHTRCKGKLFCDKNCEQTAHRQEATAQAAAAAAEKAEVGEPEGADENSEESRKAKEKEAALKAKKKKAKKAAAKSKKAGQDEFWWNNSVYASW